MTTATQAYDILRGILEDGMSLPLRWQNEDEDSDGSAALADVPTAFIYTVFDPDPAVSTCNNWTTGTDEATARLGHHDRLGGANAAWNSVHTSRGCNQESLQGTGGDGLL